MARVIISAAADADVAEILTYLTQVAGRTVAQRYCDEFNIIYDRLTDFPASGSPRPALGPHTRIAIVSPYILIYDYIPEDVTVLRVVHGWRNITSALVRDRDR